MIVHQLLSLRERASVMTFRSCAWAYADSVTRTLFNTSRATHKEFHNCIGMSRYGASALIKHMLRTQVPLAVLLNESVDFMDYKEFERRLRQEVEMLVV